MSEKEGHYLVISCDGGGIRGIIPTLLLQDLTETVIERVDLFAGTSTGSLIALALASGVTIDELADYYLDPKVCQGFFSPYRHQHEHSAEVGNIVRKVFEKLETKIEATLDQTAVAKLVNSLLFPQYSNDGRLAVLQEILPDMSVADLWEKRHKRALAATFALDDTVEGHRQWLPTVISNLPTCDQLQGTSLVDAVMCSTSAPLGYEAWQLPNGIHYADGAVYANNPSATAIAHLARSGLLSAEQIGKVFLLSLDTGYNPSSYPIESGLSAKYPWGILGWLTPHDTQTSEKFPLISAYSSGSEQSDDILCEHLLGAGNYRRARVSLGHKNIAFSDCSSIGKLRELAEGYMASAAWQEIKSWVEENFL